MAKISFHNLLRISFVAVLYFLAVRLGLSLGLASTVVSPVWPPTGVAFAAVLLFGIRVLPGIALGSFAAGYISGIPFVTSLVIATGSTLEAVSAYYLIRRFPTASNPIERPRDVLYFTFVAAPLSTSLSATVGAASIYLSGFNHSISYGYLWWTWWLGNLVGAIIVAPLILAWFQEPFRSWKGTRWLEFLILFSVIFTIGHFVFSQWFPLESQLIYLTIPFVVWATFRFEQAGSTAACCLLSAIAIWNTKHGIGPFFDLDFNESLVSLQIFMAVIAIMGLVLAAAVKESKIANLAMRQSESIQAALFSISEKSRSVKEMKDFYAALHGIIGELMYAKNFYIALSDENMQKIGVPYFVDEFDTSLPPESEQLKRGLTGYVLRSGKPLLASPEKFEELVRNQDVEQIGAPSVDWLGVPLKTGTKCFGVLAVQSYNEQARFGNREKEILTFVSEHIAAAIERKRSDEALRASEEQLRQAQKIKAIGQLAGGVAHDFNNTLMAITSYCDLLLMKLQNQDSLRQDVMQIQKAANHGTGLTRQLLAFSRKQVLTPKVLDLNQVLSEMDGMLRRMIGEDVELNILPCAQLGHVKVDPGQFQQVIFNLAVNAREAMPDGGRLNIETSNTFLDQQHLMQHVDLPPGNYVIISITDNGCGMDESVSSHAFEPFFTTKEKGTGLGLATVYGIVDQSGGQISVSSEKGKGTTFKIYLPTVDQPPESVVVPVEDQSNAHFGNILLVDDNESVRSAIGASLEMRGFTVQIAASPLQALRIFQNDPSIDLVVTDMVMPEMSGNELANRLLAENPKLKILFISGYSEETISRQGNLGPSMAFLMKPVSIQTMVDQIQHLLKT